MGRRVSCMCLEGVRLDPFFIFFNDPERKQKENIIIDYRHDIEGKGERERLKNK